MSLIRNDLVFGGYTLERSARQLWRGTEPIVIPPKAFDLLLFLAERAGRPLLKDEIMAAVWEGSIVEESNLSQNIFLLRKALAPDGPAIIKTLPGRGYQFAAQVIETPPSNSGAPADTLLATTETFVQTRVVYVEDEEMEERIPFWKEPWGIAAAGAMAGLLAVSAWLGWQRWEDRVGGPPVQVVLSDFDGSTGDPALDRALLAAMRVDLSQSPFVSVLSSATVSRTLAQMMRKPDDAVTATVAREICERNGSQIVLHGTLARSGAHYLLTEEAINCVDGAPLASAKAEANKADDLPRSVDKLTETLRHSLGESRRTIARFSAPLFPTNTGSIDALEAYSQGIAQSYRGQLADAIGLLKRAVELDPQFAGAYLSLANTYASAGDTANERLYIRKAYDLRTLANRSTQLYIVAHYNTVITGDLYASLRNYQEWTELYPRETAAWVGFAQVNRQLGNHQASVAAIKRAIDLNPHIQQLYYALVLEQIRTGDRSAAHAGVAMALSRDQDGELLRSQALALAYLEHDQSQIAAQIAWADSHPGATHVRLKQMEIALTEGRTKDAMRYLAQARDILERQGLKTLSTQYAQELAASFADVEDLPDAKLLLSAGSIDPEDPNEVVALAKTGGTRDALKIIDAHRTLYPEATDWNHIYGPVARASIALANNDPSTAIQALEPSRGFEPTALDLNWLRGRAYLLLKQPASAESEFRSVLAHPEIDPTSYLLPLSQLGLARALAQQGKTNEAVAAYQSFLQRWSEADKDSPIFSAAAAEFATGRATKE
jgi:DNA-binding winged helix-turn-helix (wHTH) protein/tetratricopeptide (TPR) repeat protein